MQFYSNFEVSYVFRRSTHSSKFVKFSKTGTDLLVTPNLSLYSRQLVRRAIYRPRLPDFILKTNFIKQLFIKLRCFLLHRANIISFALWSAM